jgi:hypothetical protein
MRPVLFRALVVWILTGCTYRFDFLPAESTEPVSTDDSDDSGGETDSDTPADSGSDEELDGLFFDDFEHPPIANGFGEGDLSLDGALVHSGAYSLSAAVNSGETGAAVHGTFSPVTDGVLYFRAWFHLDALAPDDTVNVMEVYNPLDGDLFDLNFTRDGRLNFLFFLDDTPVETASDVIPTGRWFCLRLQYGVDDETGYAIAWVDEELVLTSASTFDTQSDNGITDIRAGIAYLPADAGAFELHMDDVVLSTSDPGC